MKFLYIDFAMHINSTNDYSTKNEERLTYFHLFSRLSTLRLVE